MTTEASAVLVVPGIVRPLDSSIDSLVPPQASMPTGKSIITAIASKLMFRGFCVLLLEDKLHQSVSI